jgi:hypothetical protein
MSWVVHSRRWVQAAKTIIASVMKTNAFLDIPKL